MRIKRPRGLSRRRFLQAGAALGALPFLESCGSSPLPAGTGPDAPLPGAAPEFRHGIASGDPLADRVILWTRLTPPAGTERVSVSLSVYRDPALLNLVGTRSQLTDASRDYTVKIDFDGLAPGSSYYYQFESGAARSAIGRTRTLPAAGVEHLRFGVCSCSQYTNGFFNAYGALAKRSDLDAILHLGDYIYEGDYGDTALAGREHLPAREIISLADYRERHAQYKTDPDLVELHRQTPFITIWDDHESTDNSYRDSARNHTEGAPPAGEGVWSERKAAAQRAYFEWLPIREQQPGNFDLIYRRFAFGDLVDLLMLDTRLQRDAAPADYPPACDATLTDPDRQMLGPVQEDWFSAQLRASTARWRVVGSSVMFGQWKVVGAPNGATCGGQYLNADQWDGYQVARDRIFAVLAGGAGLPAVTNNVFLAGDIHSAWALDLNEDPNNPASYNPVTGSGTRAVEFVCNSVTSSFPIPGDSGMAFLAGNPAIRYIQTAQRGYLLLDITREAVTGEFWLNPDISTRSSAETFGRAYRSGYDAQSLTLATAATSPPADPPAPAP
ncbi:MAG: alkaline phosphatase D family protein [Stagnimonas sp.]|nr:alkaline phosphatase D family protein [Stagnimonas sp.]